METQGTRLPGGWSLRVVAVKIPGGAGVRSRLGELCDHCGWNYPLSPGQPVPQAEVASCTAV